MRASLVVGVPPILRAMTAATHGDERAAFGGPTRIERRTLVSVGAGLASFTLLDTLRIAGSPCSSLLAIGPHRSPIRQYDTSLANSGIEQQDRLRSESCSTLDNPWGFPGYALREAVRTHRVGPLLRVAAEPLAAEYFTPQRRHVVESVTREAERIDWPSMYRQGTVDRIRRTEFGYYISYTSPTGRSGRVIADNLHLGLGPGPVLVPAESQRIRQRGHVDDQRIFHAYEPHERVLDAAASKPITVAVRGGGIAASHAVDVLIAAQHRSHPDLRIVHVLRRDDRCGRQAFNVPKAAWGGQLQQQLERAGEAEADALLAHLSATTIPRRGAVARRRKKAIETGVLREVVHPDARLETEDQAISIELDEGVPSLRVDYVIEATGLRSGVEGQPVLADFLESCLRSASLHGRVDVDDAFAATGLDCLVGRVYVSGSLAFGRRYAAPDTFLGLHYASHHIAADLATRGLGRAYRPLRSVRWWLRWARGQEP